MPRVIRREELGKIVPLSDSTVYELEKKGDVLKRLNLATRLVVRDLGEVLNWLEERRRLTTAGGVDRPPAPAVSKRRYRPVKAQRRR